MLTVQNTQIYLTDRGTGIPTLFLHGVPDSADLWDGVIPHLESSFRCIAPDLPGFGRSTAPADFDCTLDGLASWVDAFVESLGLNEPVNLVVADFGGLFALPWAIKNPGKVRKIALAGNISFSPEYHWHQLAQLWRTPLVGELLMAATTRAVWMRNSRQNIPGVSDAIINRTFDLSFARPAVKRMILRLYRTIDFSQVASWQDGLHALTAKVPMLVLWGDKDPFITPAFGDKFGAQTVEHFPNIGHWIALEAPDMVADRLSKFLA
jgi:pimeloyl-ACP methyl ester carboxylesterase